MAWCERMRSNFHLHKDEGGEEWDRDAAEYDGVLVRPGDVASSIKTNEET